MKTSWSVSYVENKFGVVGSKAWANAKKAELEQKHGIPFDWQHSHGNFTFSVTPIFRDIQPINAPAFSQELLALLSKPRSFIWLKDNLGKVSWDWQTLFSVSKHLLNIGQVSIIVNRNGKACGLQRRLAVQETTCGWHQQYSPERQTIPGTCPKCGAKTVAVMVGV